MDTGPVAAVGFCLMAGTIPPWHAFARGILGFFAREERKLWETYC